ncbi:hypothetical protein [Vibrio diazotrophicus]|nr:hypothetical protein [Vibrio diazotrophicus]
MNFQLASAYMVTGEMVVKQVMKDTLYGKAKAKKSSRIKMFVKKICQ